MTTLKLMAVLDPVEALNPKASERAFKEMLISADEKWEAHLIHSRLVIYEDFPCSYVVHVVPFCSRLRTLLSRLLYLLLAIFVGLKVVKKHNVHITFCKGGHLYLGLVALVVARLTGRRCLLRVNEDPVLALRLFLMRAGLPSFLVQLICSAAKRLELAILRRADWVVTHGPFHYERLRDIGISNVSFVPLGVDLAKFRPMPDEGTRLKTKLLGDPSRRVVLYVGRLSPVKDLPTLLRAFRILASLRDDVVLVVIGSGVDEERCRRLAQELGISDRVLFLGFIPHERLPAYYNMADVYVLPSLSEEWSNTIMEAMACGVPVVATAVGANPWLVKDGETGFLVPPKRPRALARAIMALLNDKVLARRIADKAREVVKTYDIYASGRAYRELFMKLMVSAR